MFKLFQFLLIVLKSSSAFRACYDNRLGCPDGFSCAYDKSPWCCKDSVCKQRATWSILTNYCAVDANCPANTYCSYESIHKRTCLPTGISICDQYLDIHDKSTCHGRAFLADQVFELCSKYYIEHYKKDSPLLNSIMKCAEQCVIDRIKVTLTDSSLCKGLQYNTYLSYPDCFAECNMCNVKDSWEPAIHRIVFENAHYTDLIDSLAIKCNKQFKEKYDESTAESIKDKILEFVSIFKKYAEVNTRRHFEKLLLGNTDADDSSFGLVLFVILLTVFLIGASMFGVYYFRNRLPITRPQNTPSLPRTPISSPSNKRRAVNTSLNSPPAVHFKNNASNTSTSDSNQESAYVDFNSSQYEARIPSNELFDHIKKFLKH